MCDLQGLPYCVLSQCLSRYLRMPAQKVMEESQTYTPGPAISLRTSTCHLPRNEQLAVGCAFVKRGNTI